MKYLPLILANLGRKKLRTALTVGSFAVALFLFGLLAVIGRAMSQGVEAAGADRLIVRNKVSLIMPLPFGYREKILSIPGVEEASYSVWFGGVYKDPKNFFPQMASSAEAWRRVYPELKIPDAQWKAYLADRQGAVAGRDLAQRFGWKVGERIPIRSTIFRDTWVFTLRAVYTGENPEDPTADFYFHYDYLEEKRPFLKGTVGWYVVKVKDPTTSASVARAIDARFANSPWETRTETEEAFLSGFAAQVGNIRMLLLSIGAVVFLTLLLVSGNTMAIAVRERLGELAVLRTLGFNDAKVLLLIVAEAVSIALVGGIIGITLVKGFTLKGDPTGGLLPVFYLTTREMAEGMILAVVMGGVAGLVPAVLALRSSVVAALRGV